MSRPMQWAGGAFAPAHAALMGSVVLPPLNRADFAPELLVQAQRTWAQRTRTEFRSVQIMTRFLTEVVGAGDPIDVYAGVVDLIADEVRHVALCASLTRALGAADAA